MLRKDLKAIIIGAPKYDEKQPTQWIHGLLHCGHCLCRDQDDLVTLEAVKALFGQLPPYNPSVMTGATAQSPQEELVSNRMRIRAWSMVASQVSPPPPSFPLPQRAPLASSPTSSSLFSFCYSFSSDLVSLFLLCKKKTRGLHIWHRVRGPCAQKQHAVDVLSTTAEGPHLTQARSVKLNYSLHCHMRKAKFEATGVIMDGKHKDTSTERQQALEDHALRYPVDSMQVATGRTTYPHISICCAIAIQSALVLLMEPLKQSGTWDTLSEI